jgi:hypothetical protein
LKLSYKGGVAGGRARVFIGCESRDGRSDLTTFSPDVEKQFKSSFLTPFRP